MRIKRAVNAVKKRRKIFKLSKGYFGSKSRSYRVARQAVMKSQMYAYIGRRLKNAISARCGLRVSTPPRVSTDCRIPSSCTGSKSAVSTSTAKCLRKWLLTTKRRLPRSPRRQRTLSQNNAQQRTSQASFCFCVGTSLRLLPT